MVRASAPTAPVTAATGGNMDLRQFIDSPLSNAWISEPGLEYYVRKSVFIVGVIELASCHNSGEERFGLYRFLKRYAGEIPFYMEQVLNERLAAYMRRLGWLERDVGGIPQFASPLMVERFKEDRRFQLWFKVG